MSFSFLWWLSFYSRLTRPYITRRNVLDTDGLSGTSSRTPVTVYVFQSLTLWFFSSLKFLPSCVTRSRGSLCVAGHYNARLINSISISFDGCMAPTTCKCHRSSLQVGNLAFWSRLYNQESGVPRGVMIERLPVQTPVCCTMGNSKQW